MEMIKLKYTGGRTMVKEAYERKYYVFKKESEYTNSVPDELAKRLILTGLYTPVAEIKEVIKEVIKEIIVEKKPEKPIIHTAKYKTKKGGK